MKALVCTHELLMKKSSRCRCSPGLSYLSVGHLKFDPMAHINHQQEDVKDNLDVTLVFRERDLEAPKLWCLFVFVTLKEEFGCFAAVQQTNFQELRQSYECFFYLCTIYLIFDSYHSYFSNFKYLSMAIAMIEIEDI